MSGLCDCCTGVGDHTPVHVQVRPGLSAIAYRVGTHQDFLASMVAALTSVERPALAQLQTRDPDDFTLALLDAWAVACDVLTFYTERLAQESYLRTARERISLQELGRLVGYRMRPGVAAETHLAFSIEAPPAVAPTVSKDPGSTPRVTPDTVALERGLRVQSIPGPGEQPQTFETLEDIEARPEWNTMAASASLAVTPVMGDTQAWLKGAALNLGAGDVLLLAGTPYEVLPEHWDVRVLTAVQPEPDPDPERARTRVSWSDGLGSTSPFALPAGSPEPFVLRKRLDVFGHNAPAWGSMSDVFQAKYAGSSGGSEWPDYTISTASGTCVDLDGSHPDVVVGSWVVLANGDDRELWSVAGVTELSRAQFAVSGKVTRLTLAGGENYDHFSSDPRGTKVFAVAEPLALTRVPDLSPVAGAAIEVEADLAAMRPGRTLVVRGTTTAGADHTETVVLAAAGAPAAGRSKLALQSALSASYVRSTVYVHGNVALASHGETVQEILGAGQARQAFQRFALAHAPLTFRRSSSAAGADAELEVRVNDVRWDEVPTLYGAAPTARAYALRVDERSRTYVQFGDGVAGSRLPTGMNNVRARYRKGLGAAGNVRDGALAQLLDRPLGAKGVTNPLPATGGADPESEAAARASIPLAVRTLGRAVSLLDYADYARAYAGVAKAHAAVVTLRAGRAIVVTVAAEEGQEPDAALLQSLTVSLRDHGDPHVAVVVVPHVAQTFRIGLKVAVDPAYESDAVLGAVEQALRCAYAFDARDFGAPVHASEVISVAHTADGVVAVDLDLLYSVSAPQLRERLVVLAPAPTAGGGATGAGLLLLHPDPFDELETMP